MMQTQPLGGLQEITSHAAERSSRMHQRGHQYYNTECGNGCGDAGTWAARRLITPRAFLEAARNECRVDVIAATLTVMPGDVHSYLSALPEDEWLIVQDLIGHPFI
jgi:hypothetical protein